MKVTLTSVTKPADALLNPEQYLINVARVSSPENRANHETAPGLLKYLIKHKHWSPFEMIHANIEIETSRAMGRELIRHKSMGIQEFSQRYAKALTFEPIELRMQAEKNRQSSVEICQDEEMIKITNDLLAMAKWTYNKLLEKGVAKESARFILPECTTTTIVLSGCLRSWIHFLDQRCSDDAQKEVRDIAKEIRKHLSVIFPWTAEAMGWN